MNLPLTRAALEAFAPVAVAPGDAALARVLSLPRRTAASPELIDALSRALRVREPDVCPAGPGTAEDPCPRCGGSNRIMLREPQAAALRELWEYRGLFGPMRVGSGKTLTLLLAITLLRAARAVMLIPASLREKTRRDFARYRQDWLVRLPTLVSYTELGREDRESLLLELNPDVLLLDEAHHVRNDSARTRRVARCVEACNPVVACVSGTLMNANILDYHHHAVWCLGDRAPLPVRPSDAEIWASALDRDLGPLRRTPPGALELIPGGYHEWFRGSRGVVPTPGSDCDASIQVSIWRPDVPAELQKTIDAVAVSRLRPDDELLDEWELPDCLSQLALGFWYRWDPKPPDWWLNPRRAWRAYVRWVLEEHLEGFDSEGQIVSALDRDDNDPRPEAPDCAYGRRALTAWRAVRDLFTPNTVPVWIDDGVLKQAAASVKKDPTLVWVRYRAAGNKLAELGVPYFGGGTDPEHARGSIAVSIAAHGTGRNMQRWHRSLVLTPPANSDAWEQMIGRTHRAGQRSGTVYVSVIGTIDYHGATLGRVLSEAKAVTSASGFSHKLTLADWV